MIGTSRIKPGPLAATRRPRRKMTPRSYSLRILTALSSRKTTNANTTLRTLIDSTLPPFVTLGVSRGDGIRREADDGHQLLPFLERVEQQVRTGGRELGARRQPAGYGHGHRAGRARAADVGGGVPDDDGVAA